MNAVQEERLAKNEAAFRELNERIHGIADEQGRDDHAYEFICECADTRCVQRLTLTLEEYEGIRADGARFVLAQGHEIPAIEVVVDADEHQVVVEKVGTAGDVAQRLNPRAA
jgi:hypothetical protein